MVERRGEVDNPGSAGPVRDHSLAMEMERITCYYPLLCCASVRACALPTRDNSRLLSLVTQHTNFWCLNKDNFIRIHIKLEYNLYRYNVHL